ncbi:leucine-rich repeat-containing G-protein coupled receptor 6-like [Contarinia nasturtii]|uniref:leucine-rich repeat-containing G-protein coupled receptor 6-like n=1 Tax=Contarinia nasturtii TaxID=265458 RepID=UPI0012D3ECE7|nr:leucine-rich repeat-containing G-protein coupled receptor 6-like [Contarinia nasturtii]
MLKWSSLRALQLFVWLMLIHLRNAWAKNQSVILVNIDNQPMKLVYQTWMRSDLNEEGEWKSIDGTLNCIERDATDAIIIEWNDEQMPINFFDRYPDIESIQMTHKHLKSIQSTDLERANSLRRLNVSSNDIEHIASYAFDAAPKLTEIDLSFNLLKSHALNENIFTSYLIKYLYLHNNQLTVVHSKWFENLLYLRVLTLNNNRIREIDWQLFDFTPNLNVFHLHSNEIIDVVETDVQSTPRSMQTFSMHNNPTLAVTSHDSIWLDAETVDVHNVGGAKICRVSRRMHTLIAANNEIREIDLDNLSVPSQNSLVTLNLASNRLESIENVTYFHRLKYLNLSHNLLTHIDAQLFDTLINLQQLDVSHNKLKRFDLQNNNRLPHLNALDVSFNEILTLNLDGIMSQLEILNIDGNKIIATDSTTKKKYTVNRESQSVNGETTCYPDQIHQQTKDKRKQPRINDELRDFIYEQFHIVELNILELIDSKFKDIEQRVRRLEQEMIFISANRADNECS